MSQSSDTKMSKTFSPSHAPQPQSSSIYRVKSKFRLSNEELPYTNVMKKIKKPKIDRSLI
jgi:hypothetical protein